MPGHILEVQSPGLSLSIDRGFVKVADAGGVIGRMPIADIEQVLLSTPSVSITGHVISALARQGVPFAFCDERFNPCAVVFPLSANLAPGHRIEHQASVRERTRRRLWKQIIKAKLEAQAQALERCARPAQPIRLLIGKVEPGDAGNHEAIAAQRYWPLMFGRGFVRAREQPGVNAFLNYGYAILRAATARAIASAGLHPSLSVFHQSRGDALRLADDLMEPFRPTVDMQVRSEFRFGSDVMGPKEKSAIAAILQLDFETGNGRTPLSQVLVRVATSYAHVLAGEVHDIAYPASLLPMDIKGAQVGAGT